MNWQIQYALSNIQQERSRMSAQHVSGDAIKIMFPDHPDVLAVISDSYTITAELAKQYHLEFPRMDFLCGYRKQCVWEGEAISYLEANKIGWGSFGTLDSAVYDDNVNAASHKDFFFSVRLIRQMGCITNIVREFDRILNVTLASGHRLRIGLIKEYEPTADAVRTLWDRFGPVDIVWNINPNGHPVQSAIDAGQELGCEVMKWEELKPILQGR
jgi:hypothetical protein